ncbi:MAG: UvrB/UvrC motif-containing protein [Clostridia bacterium]|nr:UvrB/UvrC motif-containing protein [Clostridia bacterium]
MYDFFSDFFNTFDLIPSTTYVKHDTAVCPVCKRTYEDFQKTGKLGCSKCYEAFRVPISSVLRQIHSNASHMGKIPSRCESSLKKKRMYENLKQQLAEAVKNENYEKAAQLHKQLRAMEDEVK